MTARKPAELDVVSKAGTRVRVWPSPDELDDPARRRFQQLADEVFALNGSIGPAELLLIGSVCRSSMAESEFRRFAVEARDDKSAGLLMKFRGAAMAEARAVRAGLCALGLAGDRRGRGSKLARKRAAAQIEGHAMEGGRWSDITGPVEE